MAMTTLQKTMIGAALAAAVGAAIYEAWQASVLRSKLQALRQQQAPLTGQIEQLQNERDQAARLIASLREDNERLNRNTGELLRLRGEVTRSRNEQLTTEVSTDPYVQKVLGWKAKETKLRKLFEQRPDQGVPEMVLLTEWQWFFHAMEADSETDQGIREAMWVTRKMAQNNFVPMMQLALRKFIAENGGNLPENILQLRNYFNQPVDDALLQQYQLQITGKYSAVPANQRDQVITSKVVIDKDMDAVWHIGPGGYGAALPKPQ